MGDGALSTLFSGVRTGALSAPCSGMGDEAVLPTNVCFGLLRSMSACADRKALSDWLLAGSVRSTPLSLISRRVSCWLSAACISSAAVVFVVFACKRMDE